MAPDASHGSSTTFVNKWAAVMAKYAGVQASASKRFKAAHRAELGIILKATTQMQTSASLRMARMFWSGAEKFLRAMAEGLQKVAMPASTRKEPKKAMALLDATPAQQTLGSGAIGKLFLKGDLALLDQHAESRKNVVRILKVGVAKMFTNCPQARPHDGALLELISLLHDVLQCFLPLTSPEQAGEELEHQKKAPQALASKFSS